MRNLTIEELKQIAGGAEGENHSQSTKNNGWGNGRDGNTPGSDDGATAPSKMADASQPGDGQINTNPTDSGGR